MTGLELLFSPDGEPPEAENRGQAYLNGGFRQIVHRDGLTDDFLWKRFLRLRRSELTEVQKTP